MNAFSSIADHQLWHIAGWTMLHFLWLGTLVGIVAIALRLLLRRASANVRYVTALLCLSALTALPIAIAAWQTTTAPAVPSAARPNPQPTIADIHTAPIVELAHTPAPPPTTEPSSPFTAAPAPTTASPEIATPPSTSTLSSPADPLAVTLTTIESAVPYLPWLWLLGTPLTFALLTAGVIGTRRLRRASHPITEGPATDLLAKLASSLHITRRVTIAVCDRIASPVLIGIVRPIILLPPAALTGWSPDELEMVLLHELAHVRRWDNLINLLQRLIESLLFFHPAVWLVSTWVRREREACCDALVVSRTARPHAYAELLVALAAQMPRSVLFHPAASSAMSAGPLRSRIRRILALDDDPMLISGKSLATTIAALLIAGTLAVLYLPTIGQADESAPQSESKPQIESQTSDEPGSAGDEANAPHATDPESGAANNSKPYDPNDPENIIATFSPQDFNEHPQAFIEAYEKARENNRFVDLIGRGDEMVLVKAREPSEANWPDVLGKPPRKERVIAEKAYARLGLKLVPWNAAETMYAHVTERAAHGVKIVGGNVPDGLPLPATLTNVDGTEISNMNELLGWIDGRRSSGGGFGGGRSEVVRVYAVADGNEYLFDAAPVSQPTTSPTTADQSASGAAQKVPDHTPTPTAPIQPPQTYVDPSSIRIELRPAKLNTTFYFFYSPDSKPAEEMKPIAERAARSIAGIPFVAVNVATDKEIAENFNVDAVPTCLVVKDGKEILRHTGTISEEKLRDAFVQAVAKQFPKVSNAPEVHPYQQVQGAKPPDANNEKRLIEAYDVPNVLIDDLMNLARSNNFKGTRDARGRFILQATPAEHQRFKQLLEATPKWRDPAAAAERQKRPLVLTEVEGQPQLEWRTVGLVFEQDRNATRPDHPQIPYSAIRIATVAPGSAADWQNFSPGDSILRIDEFDVENLDELQSVIQTLLDGYPNSPKTLDVYYQHPASASRPGGLGVKRLLLRPNLSTTAPGTKKNSTARTTSDAPAYVPPTPDQEDTRPPAPRKRSNAAESLEPTPAEPYATAPGEQQAPLIMGKSDEDTMRELAKRGLTLYLMIFYSSDDPGASENYTQQVRELSAHDLRHVAVSLVDVKHFKDSAKKYDVNNIPSYLLFHESKEVSRLAGPQTVEQLLNTIAKVQPVEPPATKTQAAGKSALRYDGKSFDEWRIEWQTELSIEKRIEAVKALAAFAAHGYAEEATEAILDVYAEYDPNPTRLDSPEGQLKTAIYTALIEKVPAGVWIPILRKRFDDNPKKWQWLAVATVSKVKSDSDEVRGAAQSFLHELARSKDTRTSNAAIQALIRLDPNLQDEETRRYAIERLKEGQDNTVFWLLADLSSANEFPPELLDRLLHASEQQQQVLRRALERTAAAAPATALADDLVAVLKDKNQSADHLAAIRALAAIGPNAEDASSKPMDLLKQIVEDGQPDEQLTSAYALEKITRGQMQSAQLLTGKLTDSTGDKLDPVAIQSLLQKEREQIFGKSPNR